MAEEEEEEEECVWQQQESRQRGRAGITSMNILQFHERVMCVIIRRVMPY